MSLAAPARYAIRDAGPDDAPVLCEVVHASFREYEGRLDPPSGAHKETPDTLRERMAKGGAILATCAGEAVGCGIFEWRDGYAYIGRLGALPAHRGAGLGAALLAAAEERARARGYARARLATRIHWARLRAYYEAHGYRTVAFGTHAGKAWPTYVELEKDLAHAAPGGDARGAVAGGFRAVALDHVQLAMPPGGEDRARAFYGGVLGLAEIPRPGAQAGKGGVWFAGGPVQVHLGVEDDFRPAGKAHPGLRVRGLDALRARLTAAGSPPTDAPDLAGAARFHALDPFGNRLEFLAETT